MTDNDHSGRSAGIYSGWIDAGNLLGEGIGLVFTDRYGGLSPPPFDSLNLAYHTGDEPDNVCGNRRIVASALGVPKERFVYLEQVHGLRVARAETRGELRNGDGNEAVIAASDGAYTLQQGVVLSVLTADCVPIAMALPAAGAVVMLHAGWRGTIGNILGSALEVMGRELVCDTGEIRAVMGPAVGPCCYEVDEGRARLFVEKYGVEGGVVTGKSKRRLDIIKANKINMLEAGLKEENISMVGGCTCCDARYFSFRREGVTGRQGAFVYRYWQEGHSKKT